MTRTAASKARQGGLNTTRNVSLFRNNEQGGMVVYAAAITPILLGIASLAIDATAWHAGSRITRSIADSAAMAGALEIARTGQAGAASAASSSALFNGLQPGVDILTVNIPPTSGAYMTGDAVEVIVERPAPQMLSLLFFSEPMTIASRAVARLDGNDTCVFALNPSDSGTLKISGGAQVELPCGVIVNSTDGSAIVEAGATSCLTAIEIKTVGGYSGDCLNPGPITGVSPSADPFELLEPPAYGACDHNATYRVNGGQTKYASPGHYCKGIEVHAGGTLYLQPGLYVLSGGLTINGGATVSGTGVTIFMSDAIGPSDNISIAGGASVDLTAPLSGPYAGILFYQEATTQPGMTHSLTGGSDQILDGALYFPGQELKFSGGSLTENSPTMIIADTLDFTGSSHLGDLSASSAGSSYQLVSASMVE